MRQLTTFLVLMAISFTGWSQVGDTPKAKPLKIEVANKKDEQGKTKKGNVLRMPSIVGNDPEINFEDSLSRKPVKMLPDRELVQAGHNLKIKPRFLENYNGEVDTIGGNIHFGDIITTSKTLKIMLRDHGEIDGDRVEVAHDGNPVNLNIMLLGSFNKEIIVLSEGFNTLDFRALNQGYAGLNTAQFMIMDEENKVLYNNSWRLATYSIASIIVFKKSE